VGLVTFGDQPAAEHFVRDSGRQDLQLRSMDRKNFLATLSRLRKLFPWVTHLVLDPLPRNTRANITLIDGLLQKNPL
jgi:hypothetical protein